METTILKDIGLTESEIKVFLVLLRVGPAKAGKVVDRSGLQNPVVHRAFHSLIEKGIITYSVEGKVKYYQAIDPSLLLNIMEEKKERLKNLIPELRRLHETEREKMRTIVHQGKRGVRELLSYLLNGCSKEILSYGAPRDSLELLGDFFWQGFHNKRIKKKINVKMIFHASLQKRATELNKLLMTEVRVTENDFEELVETFIVDNKVAIIIYLDNPIGILIEEELVAKSYKRFFNLLWGASK